MAEEPPYKARILLPPPDNPECAARLLAWVCYPEAKKHSRRERLTHNLVAWWWRNAHYAGNASRAQIPRWVKDIKQRENFQAIDSMRGPLNDATDCCWAFRIARNTQMGVNAQSVGLHQVFAARNMDSTGDFKTFRDRKWRPLRPLIHVAEIVLSEIREKRSFWEERAPGEGDALGILDAVSRPDWVPKALEQAEKQRTIWNPQFSGRLNLEPHKTYRVELAENVGFLQVHGDYILP